MYLPLEVNKQLVYAIRAAAELKSTISSFSKAEEKVYPQRIDLRQVTELDETMCDVINRIAKLISMIIASDALTESEKQLTNRLNETIK